MRLLVIMDPVQTVIEEKDTSLALMAAAQERNHRVYHCVAGDVWLDGGGSVRATVRPATITPGGHPPITLGPPTDVGLGEMDVVLVRTDPPFDSEYLTLTLLLEQARGSTFIVNDPRGLREANEKLYACRFPELMPPSIVTSAVDRITDFIDEHDGAVLKPIDGHGGNGVRVLVPGDLNIHGLIEDMTAWGRRPVMVQRYLREVAKGDKRILLLNGEFLGAVLRIPAAGDFRANIAVGGTAQPARLDSGDRRIIHEIGPALREDGLFFVGIDVIAGHLTEVNVTSPTGIRQLARLTGANPAHVVVGWLERQGASSALDPEASFTCP
ncbi:glutathione synthase [Streptomyces sp. NPDC127084]|uniref:glutathione synthase n=1 Tax=Streptomyces sp. NPDC127084 TaxID=3347133 RepID=UPI00364F553D